MNPVTLILNYLKANWLFASVITYMLFSCVLKIATGINITIPCLYKTFFGMHCPGCGLTSAFIELLRLNPHQAWDHNPLIFIVVPGGMTIFLMSFLKFKKKYTKPSFSN